METKNIKKQAVRTVKTVARKANPKKIMRRIQEDQRVFADFDLLADCYLSPLSC